MTTEIENLKDLIGEISIRKDDEPETFVSNSGKHVQVYNDIYYCSLSDAIVDKKDIFEIKEGYAFNGHTVITRPHHSFNLKQVSYIIASNSKGYTMPFVFNIRDVRKSYVYAAKMLYDYFNLPKEIIDLIMWYSGCSKPKDEYTVKDFPFNFEREYKGPLPTVVSREQLKQLYELGIVKMAIKLNILPCFTNLTDESFDHVYPSNTKNRLSERFKTKEKMHECIQKVLEAFSLNKLE